MRRGVAFLLCFTIALAMALASCDKPKETPTEPASATTSAPPPPPPPPVAKALDPATLVAFAALPAKIERPDNPLSEDKVALGHQLWFDTRLSKGQDVSCNSCHDVTKAGADEVAVSIGTKKQKGTRNAPTIFNAAGGFAQGWDSRATLVEELVIPHAAEASVMAMDEKKLVAMVSSIPGYAAAFKKVFTDEKVPVTGDTIAKAISAYARMLLTPSRWDAFLAGKSDALIDAEKAGAQLFIDSNCSTCHAGKYLGAAQNQKLGVAKPWPALDGGAPDAGPIDAGPVDAGLVDAKAPKSPDPKARDAKGGDAGAADAGPAIDHGRLAITKQDVDKDVFKVPSLRNVVRTAPYLHDGSIATLEEVTKLMARHQVGKELTDEQVKSLVTFMGALTGEPPKDLVTKPELPPSGPKTPKPE